MSGIRVISASSIQAPSHVIGDSPQKIHLTPWDLVFLTIEMNQKGLLFHNPINAKDQIIKYLKQSLSSTLAFFPPLAGRLAILEHQDDNNTASSYILCNNMGALFVHAVTDNTCVADILHSNNYVPPILYSLFPLNGVKNYEGTSKPLLAVQVTELVDGIFIGCTINHVVADGTSFWHFINSWAEISRGGCDQVVITKLPTLERWFMDDVDLPIHFPFTNEEKQHSQNFKPQPPPERIFHFTKEKIMQLKSKANAEANTDKISSLQALLTHLWRSVIRNQQLDPQKETHYMLFIGVRGRMVDPPLGDNYFGNAGLVGVVTMKAWELLEGEVGKGAWEINKMISLQSEEKVKSHYASWVRTPRLFRLGGVASSNALATSSSPRFDVYGNDFGWGKPVAVRSGAANNSDGKITVFEGAEEGSIDIGVCLPYEILEAMGNDLQFMDAISI